MLLLLTLLTGCSGCTPKLPAGQPDPRVDTSEPPDTADTDTDDSGPIDTGPPPLCAVEEIEPNDSLDTVQTLPMEEWACGVLDHANDLEFFEFTNSQPGWIKVRAEAAERGSTANVQLNFFDGNGTQVLSGYLSTDPVIVFPVTTTETLQVALGEENRNFGEDFDWWLMATQVKAPVSWSFEETEPNDRATQATEFPINGTAYGVIGEAGDFDFYHVTTADEEANITFRVEAFAAGSVANLKLVLYDGDATTVLYTDYQGEIDYDPDPYFERRAVGAQDWYVQLRTEDDKGSRYHWYTLTITSTPTGN